SGCEIARPQRALDPVVIRDRQVGQAARGRGTDHGTCVGQAVEAGGCVAVQVDEGARTSGHACSGCGHNLEPAPGQTASVSDFLKKSKCSSARPVPSATQSSEFSATWQGTPVTCVRSL